MEEPKGVFEKLDWNEVGFIVLACGDFQGMLAMMAGVCVFFGCCCCGCGVHILMIT